MKLGGNTDAIFALSDKLRVFFFHTGGGHPVIHALRAGGLRPIRYSIGEAASGGFGEAVTKQEVCI